MFQDSDLLLLVDPGLCDHCLFFRNQWLKKDRTFYDCANSRNNNRIDYSELQFIDRQLCDTLEDKHFFH